MDKVLAFDQSSRTSGYAYFEDGKLKEHGKFTFENDDFGIRLMLIRDKVKELIDKYEPTEVILEDIQLQENVETFKKLAEVFGVIYELLTELNIPNQAVLSTSWKGGLGIKGKDRTAQKRNAAAWVADTYGVKPTQDEADAICIGSYIVKKLNKVKVFDWSK